MPSFSTTHGQRLSYLDPTRQKVRHQDWGLLQLNSITIRLTIKINGKADTESLRVHCPLEAETNKILPYEHLATHVELGWPGNVWWHSRPFGGSSWSSTCSIASLPLHGGPSRCLDRTSKLGFIVKPFLPRSYATTAKTGKSLAHTLTDVTPRLISLSIIALLMLQQCFRLSGYSTNKMYMV